MTAAHPADLTPPTQTGHRRGGMERLEAVVRTRSRGTSAANLCIDSRETTELAPPQWQCGLTPALNGVAAVLLSRLEHEIERRLGGAAEV
jgi:hypothetical protein